MIKVMMEGFKLYNHNKWPREKIMEYSSKRMREMIKHAYTSSNFYKTLYKRAGIEYKDLDAVPIEELPMIDKEMIRNNFFDIVTDSISSKEIEMAMKNSELMVRIGKYILVHTSGSTGKPCNFLYDIDALDMIEANMVRISIGGKKEIGWSDFPIKVLYVASVGSGYASTVLAMNGIKKYRAKSMVLNAADPIDTWKDKIKNFNPNYWAGYPSCIKILADMQQRGEINIKPKKIITGGEPLSKEVSSYLSSVFDADVIDYYGCTESIFLGMGTSWYEGMYLMDDMNYVEVDEFGRLIITPLYNKIFPLIRYRLNDVVEGFDREYKGPLPYTHIKRVIGREEEIMWFKNENGDKDFLHPLFIDDLDVEGIKEYQFVQTSDESLILNCVKLPNAGEDVEEEIKRQLDQFLSKKKLRNVKYEVHFTDTLQIDKITGKVKMVINAIKQE
ncbi:Coenzyme F390 synthetase [Thermoanaerobacter thermohydrosulfuricus WC1]|uniref:Coenzyme F390 synthetase n=1 Tax=Thermoanaerobacter thermohydrosulfuricus WC1 TaxID=1198630 RepID=M8CW69_THETY|nr:MULTISPECIES: AMP-binding protein [Thermoanaerobacter]EMT38634.1 Coenzyme F390 synthetase [Thermoanaerobacter thermohydrosulfuricus WC1]SFE48029.1 phenylacetate-CoA ligase [Thermoanaerobacter thermohydrosulfuricus]